MLTSSGQTGFIYLGESAGTSEHSYDIAVPYPSEAPFETTRLVDSGRNSNGAMVGRMVGRSMSKVNLSWKKIDCIDWWRVHRWFEEGHFTFYCRFFDHNMGRWQTRLCYLGNVKVEPCMVNPEDGEPAYYRNASFSVIDCGVV